MKRILLLTIISFFAFSIKAQINESFQGADFPPTGWLAYVGSNGQASDAEWDISDLSSNYGNKSAYSDFEDVESEGWLVTPQFTPTATNHILKFYQSQFDETEDYGSVYTIRLSTVSQNTHSDFLIIDTQGETDFTETWSSHEIDLTSFIGTPIYIAFVHAQNDGDNWYIDDVSIENLSAPDVTLNPIPTNGTVDYEITNSQTSVIDFSWDASTSGTPAEFYDFYVGTDQTSIPRLGTRTVTDAHPKTFHFNTTYYWKAVAANTGGEAVDSEVWNFTTNAQPTETAPFTIDFENDGFIPDGCDQLLTNEDWWQYSNDPTSAHIGNDGDLEGTTTESEGYFAHIDDSSPNSQNTSFLTPFVEVANLNEATISFYIISNNEGETNVTLNVEVWDGAAWNVMFTSNTNTAGWELKILDLSSLTITGEIQVKFNVIENADDTYYDDLAIDDIKFFDANPTGINNFILNEISIYPNPASDFIYITNAKNSTIYIYDILGKLLKTQQILSNNSKINIENLQKGTFILKIENEGNTSVNKLIVN